jgi:hypothetical protein
MRPRGTGSRQVIDRTAHSPARRRCEEDADAVDEPLDLDAVRLLSAWLSSRRDVQAHLDLLIGFGPRAESQIARNLGLLEQLEKDEGHAFARYRDHVRSRPAARQPQA